VAFPGFTWAPNDTKIRPTLHGYFGLTLKAALMISGLQKYFGLQPHGNESIPLDGRDNEDSSELILDGPPGQTQLTNLCSSGAVFYGTRCLGAAMLGAGLTSVGCDHMMHDSPNFKASQGLWIGIGISLYVAGSAASCRNKSAPDYWQYAQQCARDAVIPAVTAVSVYLATSHGII